MGARRQAGGLRVVREGKPAIFLQNIATGGRTLLTDFSLSGADFSPTAAPGAVLS
jgi:hypothetical protein